MIILFQQIVIIHGVLLHALFSIAWQLGPPRRPSSSFPRVVSGRANLMWDHLGQPMAWFLSQSNLCWLLVMRNVRRTIKNTGSMTFTCSLAFLSLSSNRNAVFQKNRKNRWPLFALFWSVLENTTGVGSDDLLMTNSSLSFPKKQKTEKTEKQVC